jgi:hypothetical protein
MSLRYIGIYGGLSGAVIITTMLSGILLGSGTFFSSAAFGYLVMLVALSLIFVAVKRYRDIELGGVIRFGRAFALGLGIAAVAGLTYILVWEAYLACTDYAFIDQYIASVLRAHERDGMSAAALETARQELDVLREQYGHLWFRLPMTFLEIFPVGLLVALISAALLRNPRLLPAR